MSNFWYADIMHMHDKYGFIDTIETFDKEMLTALLEFRIKFLEEEMRELREAGAAEDVVDALIDLIVVAIGTLDLFAVDASAAWDEVHKANMSKERGIKPGRPNPLGLPDLMKPEGWVGPTHAYNVGSLEVVFSDNVGNNNETE